MVGFRRGSGEYDTQTDAELGQQPGQAAALGCFGGGRGLVPRPPNGAIAEPQERLKLHPASCQGEAREHFTPEIQPLEAGTRGPGIVEPIPQSH